MKNKIKQLKLFESVAINNIDTITRVHGGYIYTIGEDDALASVFVPFTKFNDNRLSYKLKNLINKLTKLYEENK